jgi:hypothetical protein
MADKSEETRSSREKRSSRRSDDSEKPSKIRRFDVDVPMLKEKHSSDRKSRSRRSSGEKRHNGNSEKEKIEVNTMLRKSLELEKVESHGKKKDAGENFELEGLSADDIVDKLFQDYLVHKSSEKVRLDFFLLFIMLIGD